MLRAQLYLQILCMVVWHTVPSSVAIGTFTSSPAHVGGVLKACVGNQISMSCSHDNSMGTELTRWLFSSPVNCTFLIDHGSTNDAQPCSPFTVQDVTATSDSLLNSTVVVTASTSISGTVAECRDSGGSPFNQIGDTSICVIDQPTNITVDGTNIFWNGSVCTGSQTIYRVVVNGSQTTGEPIETSNTMTVVSGLLPNQEYTVSVSAYGSDCVSDAATVNFIAPATVSTISNTVLTTTDQLSTGQQSTDVQNQSSGTAVGLAVGVTFAILILIIAVVITALIIVILVVMRHKLANKADNNYSSMEENAHTSEGPSQLDEQKEVSNSITEVKETDLCFGTSVNPPHVTVDSANESTPDERSEDVRNKDNSKSSLKKEQMSQPVSAGQAVVQESLPPPKPPRKRGGSNTAVIQQDNKARPSEELNLSEQETTSTEREIN